VSRHCAKPGCNAEATATLTYDYTERRAWLDAISEEAHPMYHDLCGRHADALSVPVGWALDDRRAVAPLFTEYLAS
jgi:hypothetical protein